MFTVLLTATGGGLSAETIRLLKGSQRHRIRVVAVDTADRGVPVAAGFADSFHKVPYGREGDYAPAIAQLVRQERVDLVLPCSDEEALALAGARASIEAAGAQLACADLATLDLVSSKERCFAWLAERGFPVPEWRYCTTAAELAAAFAHFGDAFAAKPAKGRGNRDVYVVSRGVAGEQRSFSGRELHVAPDVFRERYAARLEDLLPVIVAERLEAPCYDVDTLSWRGTVHRVVPRRRVNPEGMPFLGNVIEAVPGLADIAARIAGELNLSWLYDFDVMTRPGDSSPAVIEINPRPSGSLAASVAAGIPLLDDLVSLAKGEALAPQVPLPAATTVLPFTSLQVRT